MTSHNLFLDIPDGEKTRLQELQALAKENNYADLDEETKANLKDLLLQARAVRKKTTRNRGTAVIHDVRATTARVFNEVSAFALSRVRDLTAQFSSVTLTNAVIWLHSVLLFAPPPPTLRTPTISSTPTSAHSLKPRSTRPPRNLPYFSNPSWLAVSEVRVSISTHRLMN